MRPLRKGERVRPKPGVRGRQNGVGTVERVYGGGMAVVNFDNGETESYAGGVDSLERVQVTDAEYAGYGITAETVVEGMRQLNEAGVSAKFLSKGDELAQGDRMQEYGSPVPSFTRIGRLWSAYLSAPEVDSDNLTPDDVSNMMMLLKISRRITDKKPDTLDDIEGYVACSRMIEREIA